METVTPLSSIGRGKDRSNDPTAVLSTAAGSPAAYDITTSIPGDMPSTIAGVVVDGVGVGVGEGDGDGDGAGVTLIGQREAPVKNERVAAVSLVATGV
jgi:hypothetical protein